MTKKMTIAEAVLTVAEAVRAIKDAQEGHQAAQAAFTQTVNEALAQVISRDEVALMIKEAELDDLTLEQVQQSILAAVADKAASDAVNEANAAQDERIDSLSAQLAAKANTTHTHPMSQITGLNEALADLVSNYEMIIGEINTLAATQIQIVDLKSHKIVQEAIMLSTAHGLIPTYRVQPITFTPKTDNFIIIGESVTVDVNQFITADETGDYALTSGWEISYSTVNGSIKGSQLSVSKAGEIELSHPQLKGMLLITAKALTKAEAAQQYLDSIKPLKDSHGYWTYSADGYLLNFAKDEIDRLLWNVDSSSSLFLFNQIYDMSGSISMQEVLTHYHLNFNIVFGMIYGDYSSDSALKEFGFVLKDGTRLSRSFS